jgi:flagellar hook-associated protein 2
VVAGAIDGVTLSLKAAKPNTVLNLDISDDQATVTGNVTSLVAAFNSMQAQLKKLGAYDAVSKTGGPLVGDWLLKNTQIQVNTGMTNPVTGLAGPYSSLAAIGITTDATGQLVIDNTKLTAALTADSASVAKLFGGSNGIGKRLDAALTGMLADTGAIAARDANLTQAQKDVTTQQKALDAQMAVVQQRYLTQFNALDSLMSKMQSTSSYLTQQLANIASIGTSTK